MKEGPAVAGGPWEAALAGRRSPQASVEDLYSPPARARRPVQQGHDPIRPPSFLVITTVAERGRGPLAVGADPGARSPAGQ